MKVIVAGSRNINDYSMVERAIQLSPWASTITEIVSGQCQGVDLVGEQWAAIHNIPVKPFPADWNTYGKAAGPIRNQQMAKYADALIAIPGEKSRGTGDMISKMKLEGKPVFTYIRGM